MYKKLPGLVAMNLVVLTAFMLSLSSSQLWAGGKIGFYVTRMTPEGDDAQNYSRPGWGGGFHLVVPAPQLGNILAGVVGIEGINLLDQTVDFYDSKTLLRVEQQTSQNYYRFYLGPQIGGHGNGFLRPHAGINLALVVYNIHTDVVVPDDSDRENEIRQNLRNKTRSVFGTDITLGLDLNFSNTVALDTGIRFLKSFSQPQQLGDGSVTVHPQYFQIYVGIGMASEWIRKLSSDED